MSQSYLNNQDYQSSSSPIHANYSSFDEVDPSLTTSKGAANNTMNNNNDTNVDIPADDVDTVIDPLAAPEQQQQQQDNVDTDDPRLATTSSWKIFGTNRSKKSNNSNSSKKNSKLDRNKKVTTTEQLEQSQINNKNNNIIQKENKQNTNTRMSHIHTKNNKYRGFSTSINDTFLYNDNERIDCCSITCCGILQLDKNRYLLTGIKPPSLLKRCTIHILIPFGIFITSGYAALHIKNIAINELTCIGLLLTLLTYCYLGIQRGTEKKRSIRHDLLYTKYQIQQQQLFEEEHQQVQEESSSRDRSGSGSRGRTTRSTTSTNGVVPTLMDKPSDKLEDHHELNNSTSNGERQISTSKSYHNTVANGIRNTESYYLLGQTKSDIKRAHPCCILGCYPNDRRNNDKDNDEENDIDDDDIEVNGDGYYNSNDQNMYYAKKNQQQQREINCWSRILNYIVNPTCCGCSIQLGLSCSVCATAQEAREIDNTILPPEYRRIDYITMEPFANYYPLIYQSKIRTLQNSIASYNTTTSSVTPSSSRGRTSTTNNTNTAAAVLLSNEIQPTEQQIGSNDQSQLIMNGIVDEDLQKYNNVNHSTGTTSNNTIKTYSICGIPLSRLSYRIIQISLLVCVMIFTWVFVSPLYYKYIVGRNVDTVYVPLFTIAEFFVFVATLLTDIIFLAAIVYVTNNVVLTKRQSNNSNNDGDATATVNLPVHSQLSVDALVKFFATGFCLSASLAFFWEIIVVMVVNVIVTLLLAISGIDVQAQDEYQQTVNDKMGSSSNTVVPDDDTYYSSHSNHHQHHTSLSSTWETIVHNYISPLATGSQFAMLPQRQRRPLGKAILNLLVPSSFKVINADVDDGESASSGYVELFGYDHPFLYTIYIAIGAFVVAGLIEELCKYYGFRMSEEHPDFLSQQELIAASKVAQYHNKDGATTTSTNGQTESSNNEDDDDDDDEEDDEDGNNNNNNIGAATGYERFDDNNGPTGTSNNSNTLYTNQLKSIQAQGAAITLAMVAVAIGFSCCENLIYIFVYAGGSVGTEISVLIERALFPLHPIVAAIQSIGVCHRQLERTKNYHIGTILLPAIIIHGSFDFFIVWIDFLAKLQQVNQNKAQNQDSSSTSSSSYYGGPNDGNDNNDNGNGPDDTQQEGYSGSDDIDLDGSNPFLEVLSILSCIMIMFSGIAYFVHLAREQRERLAELDRMQRQRQYNNNNNSNNNRQIQVGAMSNTML